MDNEVAAAAVLVVVVVVVVASLVVTRVSSERGTVDIDVGVDVCNVVVGEVERVEVEE